MKKSKTLIHCALLAEAKPIIGFLKLRKIAHNLYENNSIILCISGIGLNNTLQTLEDVFQNYGLAKALNIGIAGCSDESITIGELCCCTHELEGIRFESLKSYEKAITSKDELTTTLVDMEAQSFLHVSQKYLEPKDIYIFKVVSDYLDDTIPSKAFVATLIQKNLTKIRKYV